MFNLHAIIIPFQKHTDKMTIRVDHDKTAPLEKQSDPGLHRSPRCVCLKNSDHCSNKISMFYLHAIIIPFQKHTDKMTIRVDHDKTAPLEKQSDPGLHRSPRCVCLKNSDHCSNKISMFYLHAIIIPFQKTYKQNGKK